MLSDQPTLDEHKVGFMLRNILLKAHAIAIVKRAAIKSFNYVPIKMKYLPSAAIAATLPVIATIVRVMFHYKTVSL